MELTLRLLVYLVMSLAYMFTALAACALIRENPYSNKPWMVGIPSLVLTVALVAVMVHDLLS